jgi:hypothetical protein
MKVLLRNTQNGLYFARPDEWTGNAAEAFAFDSPDLAVDCAADLGTGLLEVVIHFEQDAFDLPMTIHRCQT